MIFFYFLKIIFDMNILKQFKNKKLILNKNKPIFFKKNLEYNFKLPINNLRIKIKYEFYIY